MYVCIYLNGSSVVTIKFIYNKNEITSTIKILLLKKYYDSNFIFVLQLVVQA